MFFKDFFIIPGPGFYQVGEHLYSDFKIAWANDANKLDAYDYVTKLLSHIKQY